VRDHDELAEVLSGNISLAPEAAPKSAILKGKRPAGRLQPPHDNPFRGAATSSQRARKELAKIARDSGFSEAEVVHPYSAAKPHVDLVDALGLWAKIIVQRKRFQVYPHLEEITAYAHKMMGRTALPVLFHKKPGADGKIIAIMEISDWMRLAYTADQMVRAVDAAKREASLQDVEEIEEEEG